MPAPANADEFIDLIRKSGVVEEGRLNSYLQHLQAGSGVPRDVSKFAGVLVRDGLLTFFQSEQFLLGKWKRFTIGKYKVLERLGSGGMGQVFLCEHKLMRRKVAVKVLPTAKADDASSLERFYREARAVAALDHPNIVRAYDIDQDDNLHFLVMEYVDGASLQDVIKKFGPMDVTRCCHYIYWSAIGLQHAHEAGLIHRDIKPGNILIDRQGVVKILDMGLARFFNDDEDMLTKKYEENVLGTADYLAPEQALDSHTVDGRADIYSLGATFYFMLTGNQPFTEGTVAQKLIWHQTRHPKPIHDSRPDVPEGVVAIVDKMMAKDPSDRYQNPAELAEALTPFVQSPIDPPPEREMPHLSAAAQAVGGGPVSTTFRASASIQRPAPSIAKPASSSGSPIKGGSGANGGSGRGSAPSVPILSVGSSAPAVSDSEKTKKRSAIAPIVESLSPANSEPALWESLAADTNRAAHDRTDLQTNTPKSGKPAKVPVEPLALPEPEAEEPPPPRKKKSIPLIPAVITGLAVLAVGISLMVWWFVLRTPTKPVDPSVTGPSNADTVRLTVAKKEGVGQFQTIRAALEKAVDGQHIVILDPFWDEELIVIKDLQKKQITIEGAENKEVVWKFPPGRRAQKIIQLINPEGWTIRNLKFEGNRETFNGIIVTGNSAGLVIEDVSFRDFRDSGIKLDNCQATEANRATIQRVRMIGNSQVAPEAGVLFSAADLTKPTDPTKPPANRNDWVVVRDCRFEGPFGTGAVVFAVSAERVQIKENRFWQSATGIYFQEAKPGFYFRVKIENNTFHTVNVPIRFKNLGFLTQVQNLNNQAIDIERNYFYRADAILKSDDKFPDMKLRAQITDNVRHSNSKEGSPSINARSNAGLDIELPINQDDDQTFLRYKRSSNLFRATVDLKPVGAPPVE